VIPTVPKTIGEHLKRRRLELHPFQADLAKMFGVDPMSIVNWEKNTYQPAERLMPAIVKWLGYDPRKVVVGRPPSGDGS
jgi:DNA-binding XRE family transcriptional regulator